METSRDTQHKMGNERESQLTSSLPLRVVPHRDQSPSPSESLSNMSDDEEDFEQKNERCHQDLDYEDESGVDLDTTDLRHSILDSSSRTAESSSDNKLSDYQLSRDAAYDGSSSHAQSFDDSESINGEYGEVEGPSKAQTLSEEVEHVIAEHVWNNAAIWIPPPPETDDEEVETNLVDEDEDDDDEAEWGSQSSSGNISNNSNIAQRRASLRTVVSGHFRALVAQLLHEHGLPVGEEGDDNSWLDIVSTRSLQAAKLVKPNTSKGGSMDPGGYVKVKCIASGRIADSVVVKGVVCHKNVQNRRMTSRFKNPRLLLLRGALEYQRVSNQLSSLETLLQQEIDYLKETVARIEAHHPNVLLVEKTVVGLAQDKLLAKEVSVVLNVKRPLLDRIARCTGAEVVPSLDNLKGAKAGHCETFRIEKFDEEHNLVSQAGKKTSKYLMFFEGCPRPLGCTILLRGASTAELKKVKKVVQYAVFAAYHLALETSFLADEGATLPYLPIQTKRSNSDSSIPFLSGSTFSTTQVSNYHLRKTSAPDLGFQPTQQSNSQIERMEGVTPLEDSSDYSEAQQPAKVEEFPPSLPDQYILVLVSSRIFRKGTQCKRPELTRIYYYGKNDKPLGRFLKEFLSQTSGKCVSCDEPLEMHEHRYTHPQGSLTISSKLLKDSVLPGEKEGKIWMWHRCLQCARVNGDYPATQRILISDSALDLSFGKFLELSFSNHAAASRSAACGHSVHRNCLRFFGLGSAVACFHYTPIKMHSVYVPPPQLEFNHPDEQEWLRNEASEVAELGSLLFVEVAETLRELGEKSASLGPYQSMKSHKVAELMGVLEKEKGEFEAELQSAAPGKCQPFQPVADILALNKLRQTIADLSGDWDMRISKLTEAYGAAGSNLDAAMKKLNVLEAQAVGEDLGVANSRLEQLPVGEDVGDMNPSVASGESTTGTRGVTEEDTVSDSEQKSESEALGQAVAPEKVIEANPGDVEEGSEASGQLLVNAIALNRQASSPLPSISNSTDQTNTALGEPSRDSEHMLNRGAASSLSPAAGELGERRTLSEGQFPSLVDLPDMVGATRGGAFGSDNVSSMHVTQQEDTEGSRDTESVPGGEADLSDLAPMPVSTSGSEPVQGDEVAGDAISQVSVPTSPVKGSDESGAPAGVPSMSLDKGYSRSSSLWGGSMDSSQNRWSISPTRSLVQLVAHGTARVRLPPGVNGTVVAVYDDEPTSIIAYALTSYEYQNRLQNVEMEKPRVKDEDRGEIATAVEGLPVADQGDEKKRSTTPPPEQLAASKSRRETSVTDSLKSPTPTTVKVHFAETGQQGKTEFRVTCHYAKQFQALRVKCCGGELEYIRSMSRCKKWGAQGGKSNVYFAKTMDDRFIVKQVTSTEKHSFLEFAPQYFTHLCDLLNSASPTCLAKILGIYTVQLKQGGKAVKELDLLVMENLFYGRHTTRLYDLKGSKRSRYNADASGMNKVLLDQNLIETMPTAPIFVNNKAKLVLDRAVYNDTSFLAKVNVMDYSLLVGVDEMHQELVVGIIDFIRQYTWDKHLETWVKASGILGGPKNAPPTVISPKEYKKRFRKAMSDYFVVVPDPLVSTGNPSSSELVASSEILQQSAVAPREMQSSM